MTVNQANYPVGMAQDSNGMPIPEVSVQFDQANAIMPVDVQNHLTQTIQTHNAVSIALSTGSYGTNSTFYSCDGFFNLSAILKNDASTSASISVDWSFDGTNLAYSELIKSDSNNQKGGTTDIKAPYFRIYANNGDATLAHTMSAWAYLKA
jgi:hypothetical protein